MRRLILFGTSCCHLCEQAVAIIDICVQEGPDLTIEYIDIAEQEQWQEQFAIRIPVLYDPATKQDLGWPFDQADIAAFITTKVIDYAYNPPHN